MCLSSRDPSVVRAKISPPPEDELTPPIDSHERTDLHDPFLSCVDRGFHHDILDFGDDPRATARVHSPCTETAHLLYSVPYTHTTIRFPDMHQHRYVFVIALIGIALAVGAPSFAQSAAELTERGTTLLTEDDVKGALESYSAAIEADPEYAPAYMLRGMLYTMLAKYDAAVDDFTGYIELEPDSFSAYANRGNAYSNMNMLDEAILDYTTALSLERNNPDIWYNRGVVYAASGDLENAVDDFSRVLSLSPNDLDALYDRGNAYIDLGEYDKAIGDLTDFIELEPGAIMAYINRGVAYGSLEEYDQAIDDFTAAIKLDEEFALAYYYRAFAYSHMDKADKAISDLESACDYGLIEACEVIGR